MITIIDGEPTTEQWEELNKSAKEYYDNVKSIALTELENDIQKQVFLDWWNSKSLWSSKTKSGRSEEYEIISDKDWDKANDYILWAIGQGCG
jgi:hypothetical protein